MTRGEVVQPADPSHRITVPNAGGEPPYCSCGVTGGNGITAPLLANHVMDVGGWSR